MSAKKIFFFLIYIINVKNIYSYELNITDQYEYELD